jgi:hypothetical protein
MPVHSKLWYLKHFRMLEALTDVQKRAVEKMTRMLEVPRGQRIYLAGDPSDQIFLLKIGVVKISTRGADGLDTILAFLYAGDVFGELAIVDDSPRDHVAMAHEDTLLCIYLNSPHPRGPITWWMGDSRARLEGDSLVVDVVHFTDQTTFDRSGNYHSAGLHVVERYTRTGPDHLLYEATIKNPEVFSRPWKISMPLYRRQEASVRILEYECYAYLEGQRDAGR